MKKYITLAALLAAGTTLSYGITVDDNSTATEYSFATANDYSENGINYSATTGVVTGLDNANLKFDMTLGWTTAGTDVIYVTNKGSVTTPATWGFVTAADGALDGKWNTGKYGDTITASTLTGLDTDEDNVITVTAKINADGTYMNATDDAGTSIFSNSGLKTTTGTVSDEITIGSSVVSKIYYTVLSGHYTISNASGTWSKTYDVSDGITVQTSGTKREIKTSTTPTGTIVVGGNSQIFLQTWGNGGALDLSNDIVLGATTYEEGNYNNVGIRFGNDGGYSTTLTGNLYVVEDAAIKSGGTNAVNINGKVTDKVENDAGTTVDTGSTLTVSGNGIVFGGEVDMTGIVLNNNLSFTGKTSIETLTLGSNVKATLSNADTTLSAVVMEAGSTLDYTGGSELALSALDVNGAATWNGDLDLSNATVSLDAVLAMDGTSVLTLNGITLSGAIFDLLQTNLTVDLFTGVGSIKDWTAGESVFAKDWITFDGVDVDDTARLQLVDGTVSIAIPEPAMFGLLAGLGALCLVGTRRRRR